MSFKDKSVLVTGGAGFIGSHVVDRLVDLGCDVAVIDDMSAGKPEYVNKKCQFVKSDINLMRDVKDIIKEFKPKIIINFAVKCLIQSITNPKMIHKTNVGGVVNLLESIRNLRPKIRFIQISSSEAYGSAIQIPQMESHPMNPTTPYGASKAAADMYVKSYHICYDIPTMVVRPFNCYGPRMRVDSYCAVMYAFFKRLIKNKPPVVFGDGRQTRDFTYVSDTSRGIVDAVFCDDLIGHVVNIASGKEIPIIEIAQISNRMFGKDPDDIIFEKPRIGEVRQLLADISRARRIFNYNPQIDIEDGLKMTFEWLKENYKS
jgi:UDP-glucose 4-epimerase